MYRPSLAHSPFGWGSQLWSKQACAGIAMMLDGSPHWTPNMSRDTADKMDDALSF